jgi:hypothetical protein
VRARFALLLILFLLTACTLGTSGIPAEPGVTSTPAPSATPKPTVGPTPTLPPPLVVLLIPADLNQDDSKAYQKAVYDLAQAAGMRFQVLNKLTAQDLQLEPNLKVVIALPPDPGIAALAAAVPQAQFLAVSIPGIQAGGNVSVLGDTSTRPDQVAFMAGYIGAQVTGDFFQIGALVKKDSPEAAAIETAFKTGRTYFCGLCMPTDFYTPYIYPAFSEVLADAKPGEYNAYADMLIIQKKVNTIFIPSGLDTPELLKYLSTVGAYMIGTQSPDNRPSGWIVTLQPDYLEALKAAFPDLVAGQGGKTFSAPLAFTDINPELFTPGKQADARKVLDDLLKGYIGTGVK